jgi:FtsP/CotA-like multicopper oxidase with cupredoxin domain
MKYQLAKQVMTRRMAFASGAAALAGGVAVLNGRGVMAQDAAPATRPREKGFDFDNDNPLRANDPRSQAPSPPGEPGRDYNPVVVPNGWTLPSRVVDGAKVFHLVAEEVEHEFAPGLVAHCWGYNGSVHGPVIEAVEGDRVRIFVTNRLAAPTTIHWHGILLPSGMDGVGGLSQRSIRTGETFMYEFTLKQHGTFMYHSHHDEMTQMGMGMVGLFVVHPRGVPPEERPDRDFALLLHEWAIEAGTGRPNPNEMTDFNVLTINARAYPGTEALVARLGDRVRIRIGNLSAMDHHPIHLHGYYFKVTETDGGRIPDAGQWPETTVLVPVGATRTIEFIAHNPGDWAMHCHMTHHVMNQMGHEFPNMVGVDAEGLDEKLRPLLPGYMTMGQEGMGDMGEHIEAGHMAVPANSIPMVGAMGPHDYITMGGMFTILKVRENLPDGYGQDPGWYTNPPGTLASRAPAEVLTRNGIASDGSSAPKPPPSGGHAPVPEQADQDHHGDRGSSTAPARVSAAYTCPMHPEVVSDKPGVCPKCKMKLVLRKK